MSSPSNQSCPALHDLSGNFLRSIGDTSNLPATASISAPELGSSVNRKNFSSSLVSNLEANQPNTSVSNGNYSHQFRPPPFQLDSKLSKAQRAVWKSPISSVMLSPRSLLALLVIIITTVLTIFSKGGALLINGKLIKWKLFIYSIQLETMVLILVQDLMVIGIDYFLVVRGITFRQLGHALSFVTSPFSISNKSYRLLLLLVSFCGAIIPPTLLSVVIEQESSYLVSAEEQNVNTNALGGRSGSQYCMTGQAFLFNASFEKYRFDAKRQHYVVYLNEGANREVFVPKTPNIGPYSDNCNDDEDNDIVEATVADVEGLYYSCSPTVREDAVDIESIENDPKFSDTSNFVLRIIADDHSLDPDAEPGENRALFNVTLAIKKGHNSTAILSIPCSVRSAEADLEVKMTDEGIMAMNISGEIRLKNEVLPKRVIGETENLLDRAIENSIGALGINIVEKFVASEDQLSQWDGLIRALVGAYGIRSAITKTFADKDDVRKARNVKKIGRPGGEPFRVLLIWIPCIIVLSSRLLSVVFPSIFTDGLPQLHCWMGEDNGRAGGTAYSESNQADESHAKVFLGMEEERNGRSILKLQSERDDRLWLGSMKYIRKRSRKGFIGGPSFRTGEEA